MLDGSPVYNAMDVFYNPGTKAQRGQSGYHRRGQRGDGKKSGNPETTRGPSLPPTSKARHSTLGHRHRDSPPGVVRFGTEKDTGARSHPHQGPETSMEVVHQASNSDVKAVNQTEI